GRTWHLPHALLGCSITLAQDSLHMYFHRMTDTDRPRPDLPRLDDPARLRALAHPIRLRLIEELGDLGEATATDCARRVGESVASCSFHLRQLEKYGYVERAEQV